VCDRVFDPVGRPKGRSFMQPSTSTAVAFPHSKRQSANFHRLRYRPPLGLPAEAKDIVLECCPKENGNKFDLHTAVVMPDHGPLLLSPLRGADGWNFSLPQIMHAIKGASARKINVLLGRSGAMWQEEFFDHVLRSNDSLAAKVDYIYQNRVRAGLVKVEGEYRWLWRGAIPLL
jgi:REP element-mobilizing transposase RayT